MFSKFSITNSFTDVIGQGGYATVFLGKTHGQNLQLAIKKLKVGATAKERDEMERQLNYQVDEFERYIPHLKAIFYFYTSYRIPRTHLIPKLKLLLQQTGKEKP